MTKTRINLKLYDIDGCLYQKDGWAIGPDDDLGPPESWIIENNKRFLEEQLQSFQKEQYQRVIVGYGTNRQSNAIDQANIDRGGSAAPALPIVQHYLQSNTEREVLLDPFLMADIYGQGVSYVGYSYEQILKHQYGTDEEKQGLKHLNWMFDKSKISLIYAHAHRVAALNPDADEIVIDFYDDTLGILEGLKHFFSSDAGRKLLPNNIIFRMHHYNNRDRVYEYDDICGTGILDKKYDWTVRYMSAMTYHFSDADNRDRFIDTVDGLQSYHFNNHYEKSTREWQMNGINLDAKKILEFRDQQISTLDSTPIFIQRDGVYTTARQLKGRAQIPHQLLGLDFIISDVSKEKIITEISNYMYSRTTQVKNDGTRALSWFSRHIFNPSLTEEKMIIAKGFWRLLGDSDNPKTPSYGELLEAVNVALGANREVKSAYNKKYSLFNGLERSLKNIKKILEDEVKLEQKKNVQIVSLAPAMH